MFETLGFDEDDYSNEIKAKTSGFTKTNILFSDFKDKIQEYMTYSCFENNYRSTFIEEEGYLCYKYWGATGSEYKLKSYELNGDKYIAKVIFIQDEAIESAEEVEFEFRFTKYNGNVVVDYFKIN